MNPIPFLDLRAQYLTIKDEIGDALDRVLDSSSFILGPAVESFEDAFARYVGTEHAVATSSGTSALQLAFRAAGIGPGDEVIIPAMTFIATAAAVEYIGARPVFADINPRTHTIDPELIEAAITPRTKAIVPVHLYGHPADMDPILEIARRHDLLVIEDAAQAHGAQYNGCRCGGLGDLAAFSFYPGKNLGAYGEGGAVTTNRAHYAQTVRMLRDWGQSRKYRHEMLGYNFRMDGLQGAVLGVKLKHLDAWTDARRRVAARYGERLGGADLIEIPAEADGAHHVYHVYAVRIPNREAVHAALESAGVSTGIHYPRPVHLQPCFAKYGHAPGDYPVAENLSETELSMPMYAELTPEQIDTACGVLLEAVERCGRPHDALPYLGVPKGESFLRA